MEVYRLTSQLCEDVPHCKVVFLPLKSQEILNRPFFCARNSEVSENSENYSKFWKDSEQILKIVEHSEQILNRFWEFWKLLKILNRFWTLLKILNRFWKNSENYFVTVSSHRSATSYKNVLSSRDRLSLFGRSVNSWRVRAKALTLQQFTDSPNNDHPSTIYWPSK